MSLENYSNYDRTSFTTFKWAVNAWMEGHKPHKKTTTPQAQEDATFEIADLKIDLTKAVEIFDDIGDTFNKFGTTLSLIPADYTILTSAEKETTSLKEFTAKILFSTDKELTSLRHEELALHIDTLESVQSSFRELKKLNRIIKKRFDLGIAKDKASKLALECKAEARKLETIIAKEKAALKKIHPDAGYEDPKVMMQELTDTPQESATSIIWHHRHPKPTFTAGESWDSRSIKDKAKSYVEEEKARYSANNAGNEMSRRQLAIVKHAANERAYREMMSDNISKGMYNPLAIDTEMKRILHVGNEVPVAVKDKESAIKAIEKEIDRFHQKKIAAKTAGEMTEDEREKLLVESQKIAREQKDNLMKDVREMFNDHEKCFPHLAIKDRFVFIRDISRKILYQQFFDRRTLTGSDHGILHAHNNCKNSDSMHEGMEKEDMPPLGRLLSKVIHYYHDIGYSVGGVVTEDGKPNWKVMSDHPYIGARYIEQNKAYFDYYLPPIKGNGPQDPVLPEKFGEIVPSTVIRNVILNHADIFFDSDPSNLEKMLKFSVTNSDACAVSHDDKTQDIWKNHPETMEPLMNLQKFISMFPKYGDVKTGKLADARLVNAPELVFELQGIAFPTVQQMKEKMIDDFMETEAKRAEFAKAFKSPLDFVAFQVYYKSRNDLRKIFQKAEKEGKITHTDAMYYRGAIDQFLNGVGSSLVLGQWGAHLESITAEENPEALNKQHTVDKPKYIPFVKMCISRQGRYMENALSKTQAFKGVSKVLGDEYGVNPTDFKNGVKKAGLQVTSGVQKEPIKLDSPVAHVQIASTISKDVNTDIEKKLKKLAEESVPDELRADLATIEEKLMAGLAEVSNGRSFPAANVQTIVDTWKKISTAMIDNAQDYHLDHLDHLVTAIEQFNKSIMGKLIAGHPVTAADIAATEAAWLNVRLAATNDEEWSTLGIKRPL